MRKKIAVFSILSVVAAVSIFAYQNKNISRKIASLNAPYEGYTNVGDALLAIGYGFTVCVDYYNVGKRIYGVFNPLNFNILNGRYGLNILTQCKGNVVGERFSADIVNYVIQHPTNPLNLNNNTEYAFTETDKVDIMMLSRSNAQPMDAYDTFFIPTEIQLRVTDPPEPIFATSNITCDAMMNCRIRPNVEFEARVTNPQSDYTYTWRPLGNDVSIITGSTMRFSYRDEGLYNLILDAEGYIDYRRHISVRVTQEAPPPSSTTTTTTSTSTSTTTTTVPPLNNPVAVGAIDSFDGTTVKGWGYDHLSASTNIGVFVESSPCTNSLTKLGNISPNIVSGNNRNRDIRNTIKSRINVVPPANYKFEFAQNIKTYLKSKNAFCRKGVYKIKYRVLDQQNAGQHLWLKFQNINTVNVKMP